MKAYRLSLKNDDDQGQAIVFAESATKAKNLIWTTNLDPDGYTEIRANRAPEFDGMEGLSDFELDKAKWRNGWKWFDHSTPWPEDTTDEEFEAWHKNVFRW